MWQKNALSFSRCSPFEPEHGFSHCTRSCVPLAVLIPRSTIVCREWRLETALLVIDTPLPYPLPRGRPHWPGFDITSQGALLVIEVLIDFVFIFYIGLTFRTTVMDTETKETITDVREISARQGRKHFFFVCSAFGAKVGAGAPCVSVEREREKEEEMGRERGREKGASRGTFQRFCFVLLNCRLFVYLGELKFQFIWDGMLSWLPGRHGCHATHHQIHCRHISKARLQRPSSRAVTVHRCNISSVDHAEFSAPRRVSSRYLSSSHNVQHTSDSNGQP